MFRYLVFRNGQTQVQWNSSEYASVDVALAKAEQRLKEVGYNYYAVIYAPLAVVKPEIPEEIPYNKMSWAQHLAQEAAHGVEEEQGGEAQATGHPLGN